LTELLFPENYGTITKIGTSHGCIAAVSDNGNIYMYKNFGPKESEFV